MNRRQRLPLPSGVSVALIAAILFGASTPLSKVLLGQVDPILLAGLLYLCSGIGLALWWWLRACFAQKDFRESSLKTSDLPWLAGAILAGGIVGPVLLMAGLTVTPASSASLLLNLEGVLTALLAWFVFKEHFERRLVWGMGTITAGGLLLSWAGRPELEIPWGAVAIIGATGATIPEGFTVLTAAVVGFLGYGVSLVLFVLALRYLGTARTGAYFSFAPFMGAAIAVIALGDRLTSHFLLAAVLMGSGVWLHITERHDHDHWHEPLEHDHRHIHDAHHGHGRDEEPHSHLYSHPELFHAHSHYPDLHHHHEH